MTSRPSAWSLPPPRRRRRRFQLSSKPGGFEIANDSHRSKPPPQQGLLISVLCCLVGVIFGLGLLVSASEQHSRLEMSHKRCRSAIEENRDVRETIKQFRDDKRQIRRLIRFLAEPEATQPPLRDILQFAPLLKPNWRLTSAKVADAEILIEARREQSAPWLGLRRDEPREFVDAVEQHLKDTLGVEISSTSNSDGDRLQVLIHIEERFGEATSR